MLQDFKNIVSVFGVLSKSPLLLSGPEHGRDKRGYGNELCLLFPHPTPCTVTGIYSVRFPNLHRRTSLALAGYRY